MRGISFGNGASSRSQDNIRWYGNVLVVPEAPMVRSPLAADMTVSPAGESAWIASARFDNCYLGITEQKGPKDKRPRRAATDLGIKATRQFAVDYSGASGAPVLVAVADRLRGTKGKTTWQFCTLPANKVTIDGGGFTVTADSGASLRATMVTPAKPALTVRRVTIRHEVNYHGRHSQTDLARQVVELPGGETYLVVMTIQRGAAPEVRVEGEGSAAKATVGGRVVSFDGNGIGLGSRPQDRRGQSGGQP